MKFKTALDTYVRRSPINKYAIRLRKQSPGAYTLLRDLWERVVPLKSKGNLARYQVRALENFVARTGPISSDSAILEIGSDAKGEVIRELAGRGAGSVIGINPALENEESVTEDFGAEDLPENCELQHADARSLGYADGSFSHVFSVSVFEHLNEFDQCLSEMYRVLQDGGYVYADFGPIWSCSIGHHVYAVADGEELRHWNPSKNPIPDYAHLLMGRSEMGSVLQDKITNALSEEALKWIYDQPFINRMFYEDYVQCFHNSPFEIIYWGEDIAHIDEKTRASLCKKYPGYSRFDVRNIEIVLKK